MTDKITREFRIQLVKLILSSEFNKYLEYKQTDELSSSQFFSFQVTGRVPKDKENNFNEFKESIFDLAQSLIGDNSYDLVNDLFDITFGLGVGDKLQPIDVFDESGKKICITHESNQVLMLDFWATWCSYCQEPMKENVNLIKENPSFKEKNIHIIGISCDEDQHKWIEHVKSRNWEILPQYIKPNILKVLNINGIPHIIVVDKQGIIKYNGHPLLINLKQSLLNLSEGKEILIESTNDDDKNSFWSQLDYKKREEIVRNCNQLLKDSGSTNTEFIVYTKSILQKDGSFNSKTSVFIQGEVLKFESDIVEGLINSIYDEDF